MTELPDFYDIAWEFHNGDPMLKLLTETGVEYHDLPFKPYLYVKRDDVDGNQDIIQTIADVDEKAALFEHDDYQQGELYKVELTYPYLVRKLRYALEDEHDVQTFEADIPYARRVMIDLDQPVTAPDRVLSFDLEIRADEGVPDVEEASKRILTIAAVGSDGQEFTWGYDDEARTIKEFIETAKDYKCVIGWNSLRFDFPYLENRAEKLEVPFDPFEIVHVDAFPTYRRILLIRQNSYRLDNVVTEEFPDENFYDFEDVDYGELHIYFEEDKERLLEYNLEDARAVKRLNDRYRFKDITFNILSSNGMARPRDVFFVRQDQDYQRVDKASNTLIEGVVLNLSTHGEQPCVWPNKGAHKQEQFMGAKVLEPKPGLHENVMVLDFASMYPSIIWGLNIGPETFREDPDEGDIGAPIGSFVSEPRSKFAEAYHIMKDERDVYTNKKKTVPRRTEEWYVAYSYDIGLKNYVNTFYGVIGSAYSRFYNKSVAENITRTGQKMLNYTCELAEEKGFTVVYGDTDSVIIALGSDVGDPVEEGKAVSEEFTAKIKNMISEDYNGNPERIELELDEVYQTFFITDAKKRYAGYCIWDGAPCFTYERKGFETVRGDWPDHASDMQDEILRCILNKNDPWSIVEEYKEQLFNGEVDDKLIKRVMLRRPPEQYDSKPPHVRVAEQVLDDDGIEIRVGDRIPFVKFGDDTRDVRYAGDNGEQVGHLSQAAYEYIWKKNFKSMLDRLGIEKHEETKLEDFI